MAESEVAVIKPMDRGLRRHGDKASCLRFSHDGRLLASGGFDKVVRIWDNPRERQFRDGRFLNSHDDASSLLDFSPDDKLLASSSFDGTVKVWDVTNGPANFPGPISVLYGHEGAVNGVVFLPDGKTLVTCGEDRTVRVWDLGTAHEKKGFRDMTPFLHLCVAPTTEQYHIFTASRYKIDFFDLHAGRLVRSQSTYPDFPICHVAVSPDCYHVAAAGPNRICLWYLNDRFKFEGGSWEAHQGNVFSVAFSPNSKLLASASADQNARLWDVQTKKQLALCQGNTAAVYDVAFSPDGKMLATAGEDWIVHLWDLTTLPSEYLK